MRDLRTRWPLVMAAALTFALLSGAVEARGAGHRGGVARPAARPANVAVSPGPGGARLHSTAGPAGAFTPRPLSPPIAASPTLPSRIAPSAGAAFAPIHRGRPPVPPTPGSTTAP